MTSGAQTEAMDVDNKLLDSDSPVPKPEEDVIAKGKESHTDAMITAEEPENDESELDLSRGSIDPPGPVLFHTPERASPKHHPEPSKPGVEQRLRDWEEDWVKATLSPGAWEDHEAAIHEFGNLHLNQSRGGPSDERDTYREPSPSTAAVLTPPGASIDDSMLEASNDHGISGVRTERMAKEKSKGAAATVVLARIPRAKWIMMQMMSRSKTRMVEMGANELAIRLCCAAMRFMHAFNVSFTQIVRRFHRSSNVSSACGVPVKI